MSSLRPITVTLFALLLLGLVTPAITEAQPHAPNNPSYVPPAPMTHAELVELANTPLAGANAAMTLGPLMMIASPLVGVAVWLHSSDGSPSSDGGGALSLIA